MPTDSANDIANLLVDLHRSETAPRREEGRVANAALSRRPSYGWRETRRCVYVWRRARREQPAVTFATPIPFRADRHQLPNDLSISPGSEPGQPDSGMKWRRRLSCRERNGAEPPEPSFAHQSQPDFPEMRSRSPHGSIHLTASARMLSASPAYRQYHGEIRHSQTATRHHMPASGHFPTRYSRAPVRMKNAPSAAATP